MRKRALAVLARGAHAIAFGGVFATALVSGVVLHSDFAATRRLARSIANDALATLFMGRVVIGSVEELKLGSWAHVRAKEVEILDPDGRRVIDAKGVDGRVDLRALVSSLARGKTPEVSLDVAKIDDTEVLVDVDHEGNVGIARAFFPRPGAKPTSPVVVLPSASSEDVRLSIPEVRIRHAWVHGNVVPPELDADADDVRARVFIRENRLNVVLDEARTTMRSPHAPGPSSDVHGRATGGITVPLSAAARAESVEAGGVAGSTTGGVAMHWDLVGDGAGIPLAAHMQLEGDVIDASADIASAQPEVVRRAFPALPLSRPVELHAKAHGKLPTLAVTANGLVGGSKLTASGNVGLRDRQPFHLEVDLAGADAAAFGGPATDVSGHVHVEGAIAGGAPAGAFELTTKESTVLAQRAPAVSATGSFDARKVNATFRASEPGADAEGRVELDIAEQKLAFDVNARSRDLHALARAPGVVSGSATAQATGTVDLARETIAARLTADASAIARAPASASRVHAEAIVSGPLANPVVDVTASAKGVRLTASSEDPNAEKKAPLAYPGATARARVVLSPAPRLLGVEVHVDGAEVGAAVDARATEVLLGPGGVDVRGGRVSGLGAPLELDVRVRNGALSVRAKGTDVDVRRIAAMTGIQELKMLPPGSRATMDIDIEASANRTDGHFDVSVAGAQDGSAAEVHAELEGRHVSGRARVGVGTLGWVEVQRAELELPGALGLSTLKRATGALDLRGEIDLSRGAALFGGESIETISGTALLSARVERGDARNLPTVYASARTRGLDVVLAEEGKSTHVGGIDGALHAGYDGATDEAEASLLTWDASGIVASADAKARVPLVGWATGAKPFDRDAVGKLEIAGVLDVPRHDVSELPGIFARPDLVGAVSLHAALAGSVAHPDVHLVAVGEGMSEKQPARAQVRYAPIDGIIEARWDGNDVVATLRADESERAEPASEAGVSATLARTEPRKSGHVRGLVLARVPAADLLAGRALGWNASAELDVADLELAPLPLPMDVRGVLTGRVKLQDLMGNPLLQAHAHVQDLGLAGVRVLRGDLMVDAKDGSLDASARVDQDDGGNGRIGIVSSSLQWRGIDVAWDGARPTKLDYALDRLRLSLARPFVRRFVPEIDGVVGGRGSATIDAKSHVFEGGVALSGGRLYVSAIGEEITDVSAVARFERDGAFRIQDATAKIGAGTIKAAAAGRFRGLRFESADVVAVVPSKDGVPLSAEGATFADATGEVKLSVRVANDGKSLLVTATVPRAKIALPDRSTQQLQSLDPDRSIAVGIRRKDGTFAPAVERPEATKRTHATDARTDAAATGAPDPAEELMARFTVTLGDDVALEGRGLRLVLGGRTVVDVADEVAVSGQITLRQGGTIDVQGRKFVVDHGTVTFVNRDAPSDPIVIAAAYWDAPDRTRIWVEFSGPLKTGKLTLRSEPAFSKNEILSILLFGRPDPNQTKAGDAKSSDAQAATNAGTGALASGLNKALSDLDEDFELEQDTTSANRTRTKLGYRLRRNLKVQLGYASGFSQREPDTTYLFLEWQFIPQWSLVGTRGDRGTSILDLLFQHRY